MKMQTTIKPRRSGEVIFTATGGEAFTFKPDATGDLVCEVPDLDVAVAMARTGEFFAMNAQDEGDLLGLLGSPVVADDHQPDGDDLPDDDEANEDAAPVEVPRVPVDVPKAAKGPKAKKAR